MHKAIGVENLEPKHVEMQIGLQIEIWNLE
jgi:hypothetical protein